MLHRVFGRKLNQSTNQRKRLFRNLTRSLILHGKIKTTLAKAKAIQPLIEKLVTKAKTDNLHNRRIVFKQLAERVVVDKLFKVIGPAFKEITGGYTRIIKFGTRKGDNSLLAVLTFTKEIPKEEEKKEEKALKKVEIKKEKKVKKEKEENAKNKTNQTK